MSEIRDININEIKINPNQPRSFFDVDAIIELANSIRENGLVQPISVRIVDDGYELVAGERRLRATKYLKYETIPAYIVESDVKDSAYMAVVENVQREDLSAIEEAKAYDHILRQFNMTQAELAKRLGKSQPAIANKLRLLQLDINVQNAVESKLISERHARSMLSLDGESQNEILDQVIKNRWTVSQVESEIAKKKKEKKPVVAKNVKGVSRNVQIGINTIKRAVEMVEKSGISIDYAQSEEEDFVTITLKITK